MKLKTIKGIGTLLFLLFFFVDSFCQETTYYYGANHKPVTSEEGARFSKKVINKNKKTIIIESSAMFENEWVLTQTEKIKEVNENEQLITIKSISGDTHSVKRNIRKTGEDQYEFADYIGDKLLRIGNTSKKIPLCLQDTIKEYYQDGQIKTIAVYRDNQIISNKNWLEDGTKYCDNLFYAVDEEPQYLLGQQQFNNFIVTNITKRELDLNEYSEKIVLEWVINDSGKMEGVHAAKSFYPGLSDILVEIVKEMPNDWRPATLNGENVNYYMRFPINFKSQKKDGFESLELVDGFVYWD